MQFSFFTKLLHICSLSVTNITNPMQVNPVFPYAAIAGQSEFKLAIELLMVDASIGGILVLGDKGTGKTTTVRSLSQLMHAIDPDFNFVNLPVGASEDRVLGSVDLEILINEKRQVLRKGLLALAHRGILYIDEVNLLNDYLTDILLDAAASGGYHLEREGLSMWQDSRFCLIGTMNPEEGELRPQLLDRFGLCVEVKTPQDIAIRKTITQRRIDFDLNAQAMPGKWANEQQAIQQRLLHARNLRNKIELPEAVIGYASGISMQHHTEGLRADILLVKAARAYAALCGDITVTTAHVDTVAPFVLKHRSKKASSGNTPGGNNSNSNNGGGAGKSNHTSETEKTFDPISASDTLRFLKTERQSAGMGKAIASITAQRNTSSNKSADRKIDVFNTVKNYTLTGNFLISYIPDRSKGKLEVYFLIDSSGSMAQEDQIRYAKGVVQQTLQKHRGQQITFAGIGLRNGQAEIFHHTTTHADQFVNALQQLKTGGKTNLTAGFEKVYQLSHRSAQSRHVQHHLYVFTDGRINAAIAQTHDPMAEAVSYYKRYLKSLSYTQVLNTEHGFVKLDNARLLAEKLQVRFSEIHR
jgi:magnesium chelatase subunit D